MNRQGRRLLAATIALVAAVCLSGCAKVEDAPDEPVGTQIVQPIPGTDLNRITLDEDTMQQLGIETAAVRAVPIAPKTQRKGKAAKAKAATAKAATAKAAKGKAAKGKTTTVIPVTALIYDPEGGAWTYVMESALAFSRRPVVVDRVVGPDAYLSSGPREGTAVVTVGAPELMGVEFGVGAE
jgi:hypothetical protein